MTSPMAIIPQASLKKKSSFGGFSFFAYREEKKCGHLHGRAPAHNYKIVKKKNCYER